MTQSEYVSGWEETRLYGVAAYLFCQHLEQNGLYDYQKANEGYNLNRPNSQYCVSRSREQHKVLRRSGAAETLDIDHASEVNLVQFLVEIGCITREGNDIALATGYWRKYLADEFGFMEIFQEGAYSVPARFCPSRGLAIETYEQYRKEMATKNDVIEAIGSTTHPKDVVLKADRVFDTFENTSVGIDPLLSFMHTHDRFTTAVASLSQRVIWFYEIDLVSRDTVCESLEITDSRLQELLELYRTNDIWSDPVIN